MQRGTEKERQKIIERDESHVRERERERERHTDRKRENTKKLIYVRPTGFEPAQLTLLAILPIPKDKT